MSGELHEAPGPPGAGGHRDSFPSPAKRLIDRLRYLRELRGEEQRTAETEAGGRDMTPALGTPGGPASWRRAVRDGAVALHQRRWRDARWSYLYGKGSAYATDEQPDPEQIAGAARRARTGAPPPVVQGPMMKPPVWTWEIPLYFWTGGIAAGSSFVALACDLTGDERSARIARGVALAALVPSPPLLIMDLGRPERFYNMLRVFKPRSPMSTGAWALTLFGNLAAASVGADLLGRRRLAQRLGAANAVVGGYLGSYTGVLLASTATPLWGRSRLFLGPIFVATATATGAAACRLVLTVTGVQPGHRTREALARVETGAITAELILSTVNEHRLGRLANAIEEGTPGRFLHAAKWLVRFGLTSRLVTGRFSGPAHQAASVAYLGAGLCFRYAWVLAGPQSARDDEAVARNHRAYATAAEPEAVLRVVQAG
jgi:formate-dependent nitrite reductase membrane component NrfD